MFFLPCLACLLTALRWLGCDTWDVCSRCNAAIVSRVICQRVGRVSHALLPSGSAGISCSFSVVLDTLFTRIIAELPSLQPLPYSDPPVTAAKMSRRQSRAHSDDEYVDDSCPSPYRWWDCNVYSFQKEFHGCCLLDACQEYHGDCPPEMRPTTTYISTTLETGK